MSTLDANLVAIVSGLPRSGTSMMMRMIDAGGIPALVDNIRKADEDNPRGYYEFEPVKKTKEDPSWLEHAGGKVVKMVYRLLYDLPKGREYRVIFMRRKLEEVVASQDVMLSRMGREGGALGKDKLIALFQQQLADFDRWVRQQPNFKVLYVSYNDTLTAPRDTVAALNEFLGGRLDTAAMLKVVEPELYRQRAQE
jgi:hypothetical protein